MGGKVRSEFSLKVGQYPSIQTPYQTLETERQKYGREVKRGQSNHKRTTKIYPMRNPYRCHSLMNVQKPLEDTVRHSENPKKFNM
jgi:hypothetical protein